MGQANKDDAVRVFGKPTRIDSFPGEDAIALIYTEPRKETTVRVKRKTGIVLQIEVVPEQPMSKREAAHTFGSNFRIQNYSFDECLNDGGDAPLYESSTGNIQYMEYRHRGIFLALDDDKGVTRIEYASSPPGAPKSSCADQRQKHNEGLRP